VRAPGRILAVALVALGVALAGCGGDDKGKPIPASTASSLQAQLDNVQARLDQGSAGACKDILAGPRGPNKEDVQQLIDDMPDSVDSDTKSALQDSFDHLWDLVSQECDDKASKPKETNTTPIETQTEETTPAETTPTETTPTETAPTDTTTEPDTAPLPNDGNGNGGVGNGNGNGGGGVGPGGEGE